MKYFWIIRAPLKAHKVQICGPFLFFMRQSRNGAAWSEHCVGDHLLLFYLQVYQGPRCKYTIRGLQYNITVLARVIAVNTAGQGEPSEEVSLSTQRGIINTRI